MARFAAAALLCISALYSPAPGTASDNTGALKVAAYYTGGARPVRVTVGAAGTEIKPLSITPIDARRPLLLVIDPNSYPTGELSAELARWGAAVARSRSVNPASVRIGLALLEGVLSDPVQPQSVPSALQRVVTSYLQRSSDEVAWHPGRVLDILANLVDKAAREGPVDIVMIGMDRELPGGTASPYLSRAIARRLSSQLHASGSTIYGYMKGSGALSKIVADSGGVSFGASQTPESVLAALGKDRANGVVIDFAPAQDAPFEGWLPLNVTAVGDTAMPLRSPRAFWWVRDGSSAPDSASVLRALELLATHSAGSAPPDGDSVREAVVLDPYNPVALLEAARGAVAGKNAAAAQEYGARAVSLLPVEPAAVKEYCDIALKAGQTSAARQLVDKLRQRGYLDSVLADRLMAGVLAGAGQYGEAALIYDRLMASPHGNADADLQAEYAWVLLKTGKTAEAARQFESARAAGSTNPKLLLIESGLAAANGNLDEALEHAQRAYQQHPESPDVLMQLAAAQLKRNQWSEAVRTLDSAHALDNSRQDVLLLRAEADIGAGRAAEAGDLLLKLSAGKPGEAAVYNRIADLQLRIGMIEGAARTLEAAASASGADTAELLLRAAELRERRGEYGQALFDYRAALLASPQTLAGSLSPHVEFLSTMMGSSASSLHTRAEKKGPEILPPATKPVPDLIVPGGAQLLARTLGVDAAALSRPDAAERLFAHILEMSPTNGDTRENPLVTTLAATLKDYDDLLKHLLKLKLIHPEQDLTKPAQLAFPLSGPDVKTARTPEFLSFFGIKYKAAKPGTANVQLTMAQSRTAESRMRLLRNLGVDLLNRNLREIRISIQNDRVPMLLGRDIWAYRILKGASGPQLLRSMIESSDAMRLYVALARCSSALPQGLISAGLAGDLLRLNRALSIYGPSLEFSGGRLVLPGSSRAWETLLGASLSEQSKFLTALLHREDEGRSLLLYQALSSASEPVRRYLTDRSERLAELYQLLAPYDASRLVSALGDTARQDLGRILRLASADEHGIYFEIPSVVPYVISTAHEDEKGTVAAGARPRRYVDLPTLVGLMTRGATPTPTLFTTPIDTLELVEYIKRTRPDLVSIQALGALLQSPNQTPLYLDIIWYVHPDPEVTARYIAYCRSLAETGNKGWNVDKTRSSQAFFYVLSSLSREGVISPRDANRVLASALAQFETNDEAVFAQNLASLWVRDVQPAVSSAAGKVDGDPVLRALAGRTGKQEIRFEARYLEFDPPGLRANRMTAAIQQQTIAPISKVIEAYGLIAQLDTPSTSTAATAQLLQVLREIGSIQRGVKTAATSSGSRAARADTDALRTKIEEALQKREPPSLLREQVAAALNVELGMSLLAYCYADNATQDTALLAFDPNFIRRQSFYPELTSPKGAWRRAYVSQDDAGASTMTGSIAGVREELSRLETLQSGRSFGPQGAGLVPALLSGMRGVPISQRTDRAQEYVALSVRLGLELALRAGGNPALSAWLDRQSRTMLGPRRRELLAAWIAQPDLSAEAQVFSRSELFQLSRAYLAGAGDVPEFRSPVLDKLRSMSPAPGTPDAAAFESEIEQYGPVQTSRSGMNQPSFAFADSYEALEANVRPNILFERICDLKVRIAELNYAMGLPAALAGFEGELALKDIVPEKEDLNPNSWRSALQRIARLDTGNVRRWMDELSQRGCLSERLPEQTQASPEVGK